MPIDVNTKQSRVILSFRRKISHWQNLIKSRCSTIKVCKSKSYHGPASYIITLYQSRNYWIVKK